MHYWTLNSEECGGESHLWLAEWETLSSVKAGRSQPLLGSTWDSSCCDPLQSLEWLSGGLASRGVQVWSSRSAKESSLMSCQWCHTFTRHSGKSNYWVSPTIIGLLRCIKILRCLRSFPGHEPEVEGDGSQSSPCRRKTRNCDLFQKVAQKMEEAGVVPV